MNFLSRFSICFMLLLCVSSCGKDDGDEPSGSKAPESVEAIDLGLSVKWASCNVGAQQPWEYGGIYAWGETEEKDNYSQETYKYYDSSNDKYINIGNDIKGTKYDVAHVKWGGKWRMPTESEMSEMISECQLKVQTINNVKGIEVVGPNGNKIFLPYAPHQYGTKKTGEGRDLRLWCSNIGMYDYYATYAYGAGMSSIADIDIDNDTDREDGFSVRAVCP